MRTACRFGIATLMAAAVACESNAPGPGIDACESIATFKIDSATTNARLESSDCSISGFFTDLYSVALAAQTEFSVLHQSDSFDTYLEIFRDDGAFVAVNDDSVTQTVQNSMIDAILPAGTYLLAPSSFGVGVRGPYALTTAARSAGLAACDTVWVGRGVTIADSIVESDCAQTGGSRADVVLIFAVAGSVLRLHQRSAAVDARLELRTFGQAGVLASNNDSATGVTTDAFISYNVPQSALYVVTIGVVDSGDVGAYTFEVETQATLAGASAARMGLSGLRTPKGLPPRVPPR